MENEKIASAQRDRRLLRCRVWALVSPISVANAHADLAEARCAASCPQHGAAPSY